MNSDANLAANTPKAGGHAPDVVRRNVERVLSIEEHVSRNKGVSDTVTDWIGRFVGTMTFVIVHCVGAAVWVALNSGLIPSVRPFDPYPFNFLSALTSLEAVLLAAFILMIQTRISALADKRDHFDLQVNLMAEQEASMTIQMLERISRKLGVDQENMEEALALSRTSSLEHLAEALHARLPDAEGELPQG